MPAKQCGETKKTSRFRFRSRRDVLSGRLPQFARLPPGGRPQLPPDAGRVRHRQRLPSNADARLRRPANGVPLPRPPPGAGDALRRLVFRQPPGTGDGVRHAARPYGRRRR